MVDVTQKLSVNFSLEEMLKSNTAQRFPDILAKQYDPPEEVVSSLSHLVGTCLQMARTEMGFPIRVTSGYRCPELNSLIGGASRSQHMKGQAADLQLSPRILSRGVSAQTTSFLNHVRKRVLDITGKPLRKDVNPNFYLFAYLALNLKRLRIDQLIHEFGRRGSPAWIHLSVVPGKPGRNKLTTLGKWVKTRPTSVAEVLEYGT